MQSKVEKDFHQKYVDLMKKLGEKIELDERGNPKPFHVVDPEHLKQFRDDPILIGIRAADSKQ